MNLIYIRNDCVPSVKPFRVGTVFGEPPTEGRVVRVALGGLHQIALARLEKILAQNGQQDDSCLMHVTIKSKIKKKYMRLNRNCLLTNEILR